LITLKNITKSYGPFKALDDLNLSIPKGEVFGLLGPNGAGKTTLIKLITGQLSPSDGIVSLFEGQAPHDIETRKHLGVMPQDLALYPELSVSENMKFFGHLYGLKKEGLSKRIPEVLSLIELESKKDVPTEFLSGGMKRRASLACALIHQPKILILDEPTAGVDPILRRKFWDLFKELASLGSTILMTTHHISEAIRCDQVAFLREGKLIEEGDPSSIVERYKVSDLEEAFAMATQKEVSL
jgi:ABC-2 type transport system ATP-binding protein